MVANVEVGLRVPHGIFSEGGQRLARFARVAEAYGLDRLWVGDHVSFRGGQGYDGLLQAMALAAVSDTARIQTAVYLLPLRHPLPVARQVATIAELSAGRFVFGVGVGGDDRYEVENCGVDPRTRGARMDESLVVVRRLLQGDPVTHEGDAFALVDASIRPAPDPPVPIVVGGRSAAALRRAGSAGDGWLGVFVDASRFRDSVATVEDVAAQEGRDPARLQHGMLAWCGFGSTREGARPALARAMESLYQLPFERFERYSPYGTPDDVASMVAAYVDSGASYVLLAGVGDDLEEVVTGAADVRSLLRRRDPETRTRGGT
jgi:probable F420-dependent oxidoreductase